MHCTLRQVSLVVLGLFTGLNAQLFADTVRLKSGFSIDGKVSESPQDPEKLVIELDSTGRITIPRRQVEEIERNARTGIPPERPAAEGQAAPLIVPNMVAVTLKKGHKYYGSSLYGVRSPQSDDRTLVLTIPSLGEVRVPQEAVERIEPVAPLGRGEPAPAAAGPRTIRTTHRVKLENGQVIAGTLVPSRPEEPLVLDLDGLGRIYIDRNRVVEINAAPGQIKLPEPVEEPAPAPAPAATEETRPPVAEAPASTMISRELKEEIQFDIYELTRQRQQNRVSAERRLVNLGPVVIPFLAQVARDPFDLVRRAVARIVRDIGHPAGVPIVIDMLMDEDNFAREIAAEALRKITSLDLGYDPYASHERRFKAQLRWKDWWEEYLTAEGRGQAGR